MSEPKVIFKHDYDVNSLGDLEQDVGEAVQADYNPLMKDIPGEFTGTFTVTITYTPSEDDPEKDE